MTGRQLKFLMQFKKEGIAALGKTDSSELQELTNEMQSLKIIAKKQSSFTFEIIDLISFEKLIELKSLTEFKKWFFNENKNIVNDFSNSTIGQVNQPNNLKIEKNEINQQNSIISFVEKFWWKILIPIAIGILLILIERGIIDIGI